MGLLCLLLCLLLLWRKKKLSLKRNVVRMRMRLCHLWLLHVISVIEGSQSQRRRQLIGGCSNWGYLAEPTSRSRTHIEPTTEPQKLLLLLMFVTPEHLLLLPGRHSRGQLLGLQDLMLLWRLGFANHQLPTVSGCRHARHVAIQGTGKKGCWAAVEEWGPVSLEKLGDRCMLPVPSLHC